MARRQSPHAAALSQGGPDAETPAAADRRHRVLGALGPAQFSLLNSETYDRTFEDVFDVYHFGIDAAPLTAVRADLQLHELVQ